MNLELNKQNILGFLKKAGAKVNLLFAPSEKNDYRPQFLQSKILAYSVILLLIIKVAVIGTSINFPKNIFFADITKSTLTSYVNQGREAFGLQSLTENKELDEAAELKARDMLQKGYFSHQSPEGLTPWFWFKVAGYNYKYAGENLAIGFIDSKEVYDAWYNSISHRENMLNPNYKEIGTAILNGFGENKTIIVVQLFGSEKSVKAPASLVETVNKNIEPINTDTTSLDKSSAGSKKESTVAEDTKAKDNQFVLSQSTEALDKINPYLKYLNAIAYNYEEILQNIIYSLTAMMGIALLMNIFINFNIQRKDLIFRALLIIIILLSTSVINKDLIVQIIPHEIVI